MSFDVWTYVARMGSRMKVPNDSFFMDGDAVCGMRTAHYFGSRVKTAEGGPTPGGGVGEDEEEYLHEDYAPFQCLAPGCQATFTQLLDSEAHYATKHRHSCSVCNKSLPSNHFLEIHIMENHDSFFQVLSEKKASYSCFLETCDSKYWNADERREHCIKSHGFPANFKFDSRNQKKAKRDQQKKSSKQQSNNNRANKTGSHHENVEMMDQDDVKASQQPLSAKEQKSQSKQVLTSQENKRVAAVSSATTKAASASLENDEPMQEQSSPTVQLRKFSFGSQKKQSTTRREVASDRRLSLFSPSVSDTKQNVSSTSQPSSPEKVRGPVSLSRMGERLSVQMSLPSPSKRVTVVCHEEEAESISSPPPLPSTAPVVMRASHESPIRFRASSLAGSKSNIPQLIRTPSTRSQPPPPVANTAMSATLPRSRNSAASAAEAPSYNKSSSLSSPRKPSRVPSTSSSSPEHSKLNPSTSASSSSSQSFLTKDQPQCTPKSKIPVLRSSSVKVPREICFGYGVNRSFSQRISNWYQKNSQPSNVTLKSIDKSNFDDMKMALD